MKPIQPIMSDVVVKLVRPAPLSAEKVLFAWRTAVGAALARVTVVRLRSDGCLLVRLQDERWRPELERAGPLVRERLTAFLGPDVLRDVKLVGEPIPARRRASRSGTSSRRPASQAATGPAVEPTRAPASTRRRTR